MNKGLLILVVFLAIIFTLVIFVIIVRVIARITKGTGDDKSSSSAPPDNWKLYR